MKYKFLCDFLDDTFGDSKDVLIDVIDRCNISLFAMELLKKYDSKRYKTAKVKKIVQKKFNKEVLEAAKELIDFGEKENVKIVFIKGIFLAADIYEDVDERLSTDIDVCTGSADFPRMHFFLRSLGYTCNDLEDQEVESGGYLESLEEYHICYEKFINGMKIFIEVHNSIVNAGNAFYISSQEFLANSEKKELLGEKTYVLSLEYNLIYLMLHFIKHIPLSYMQYSILKIRPEINLGNVNDIALLVNKYREIIDWDKVVTLSKNMYIAKYILAVAEFINHIYRDIFEERFLEKLSAVREYSKIADIRYEERGWGKFMWMFDDMLDIFEKENAGNILRGTYLDYIDIKEIPLHNSRDSSSVEEKYNFEREFPITWTENKKHSHAKLEVQATKEFIDVTFNITDKKCCVYEEIHKLFDSDGVEIYVVTKNGIEAKLFTIAYGDTEYILIESTERELFKSYRLVDKKACSYELHIEENVVTIYLRVPWSYLSVDPEAEKVFAFNVGGLISNPVTQLCSGNCNLFGTELYDLRQIPVIQF